MKTKHLKAAGAAVSLLIASGPALASGLWSRVSAGTGLTRRGVGSRSRASGVVLLAVLAGSLPAGAMPMDDGDGGGGGGGGSECLGDTTASFSVSPAEVTLGESVTLRWSVHPAVGCVGMTQSISGGVGSVSGSGSKVIQPLDNSSWVLRGHKSGGERDLASSVSVTVKLPCVNGRTDVTITSGSQVRLFVRAIDTANATVRIQNHVNLNLSGRDNLHISPGVHIIGGRSSTEPGPRLFTTTFPRRLFNIGTYLNSDNVRISGVRLEGAEMGSADSDTEESDGIAVYSSVNVEIDNNEISGWRGSGVTVLDPRGDPPGRINLSNYSAVHVHDNFIHHNQHYGEDGYGVNVSKRAYALIEKNVFDYNRHAIASDGGDNNVGYYAHRNLVLSHGGFHTGFPLYINTHQFDVHGNVSCWGAGYYCGKAGEKFDMRYNTILYTKGTAIKVRGKPSIDATVDGNVFTHWLQWGNNTVLNGALVQNDPGDNLYATNNTFGAGGLRDMISPARCDFDGDGVRDHFYATGATWWYVGNEGYGNWVYLNTSTKRLGQLTLGDVNGDGRCDVKDNNGAVYLGGVTVQPSPPPSRVIPDVRWTTCGNPTAVKSLGQKSSPASHDRQ